MLITGVTPPDDTTGEVAVTEVTSPEVIASRTLVPLHISTIDLPFAMLTPEPPEVFRVIANPPVVAFLIKYSLLAVGQITFRASVKAPLMLSSILRDSSAAPLTVINV
jgi:hypothetical protein